MRQSIMNGDYAFLEYVANNWLDHLRDLDPDIERLGLEKYSDIRGKLMAVLDFHQPSRAHDYSPAADIACYFLAFSDCPEIYLHPTLRDEAHLNQRSGEGSSLYPLVIQRFIPDPCQTSHAARQELIRMPDHF